MDKNDIKIWVMDIKMSHRVKCWSGIVFRRNSSKLHLENYHL